MLNDKLHYGKINYDYTLVSSGGYTHADDQTRPYASCCHLLTVCTVDSHFLTFCCHLGDVCMHDEQPTILKNTMHMRITFHTQDIALFWDF